MLAEERVRAALDEVLVPGVRRSLNMMNLVRGVTVAEEGVKIQLATAALSEDVRSWLKDKVTQAVGLLDGGAVTVDFVAAKPSEINDIKKVIAVMSGKGGVGKSLVSGLIAVALRRQGAEVGILDADITGPTIPRMFGIAERPSGDESGIMPVLSKSGIEIMSLNLLVPREDEAVIWRGPLISRAITQFWEDVLWGKLDYLVLDLPPGTADAALTVMQLIPITGVVMVSTPQVLATMIVKKAVGMARRLEKPIIGVVENMGYLYLPEQNKRIEIFGPSQGEELAKAAGAPFLGQIPIDPELARLSDQGKIERYSSEAFDSLARNLLPALTK